MENSLSSLILSKLVLTSIGKYGLSKIIDEPFLSRAIRATADRYPDIDGLYDSLKDWRTSDSFKVILQEFTNCNNLLNEEIESSFIDSGFYCGELTQSKAKDIIKTFFDMLYASISFANNSDGALIHEKREEARHSELKELLLQISAQNTGKEDKLPDVNFIESLSQNELDFLLVTIFTYQTERKSVLSYITKDEWDSLLNRFKDLFEFREDKGAYYGHLKKGYASAILNLIKSNSRASKKLIDFFSSLFFDRSSNIATLGSAQIMILNLKLLPTDISLLLDQLIKKAESHDSYSNYANIIDNMAIALLENIQEIDELALQWLERFMMVRNSHLRGNIGDRAVKSLNTLPSALKETLFSLLIPEPNENPTVDSFNRDYFIRGQILLSFMDIYEGLPDNYKKRFDEILEKIKFDENVTIKAAVANRLLMNKSPDFKFYSLLDDLLADDSMISNAIGGAVLGILSAKGNDKYEYALNKIKSIKDDNSRYQILLNNFFDLDKPNRVMVEEYVERNPNSYHAQLLARTVGEHLKLDSDDYMQTLEKFKALSNSTYKSTMIGIILGIAFNCRSIPRPIREDILSRYANGEDHNIREQIIRAVLENWAQFSDNMHEVVFNIVKKMNYHGHYVKNNYDSITEPYKTKFKEYYE